MPTLIYPEKKDKCCDLGGSFAIAGVGAGGGGGAGGTLDGLTDVTIASPAKTPELLRYDTADSLWKNTTLSKFYTEGNITEGTVRIEGQDAAVVPLDAFKFRYTSGLYVSMEKTVTAVSDGGGSSFHILRGITSEVRVKSISISQNANLPHTAFYALGSNQNMTGDMALAGFVSNAVNEDSEGNTTGGAYSLTHFKAMPVYGASNVTCFHAKEVNGSNSTVAFWTDLSAGTNKWAFWSEGTAYSFIAGTVAIGFPSPPVDLEKGFLYLQASTGLKASMIITPSSSQLVTPFPGAVESGTGSGWATLFWTDGAGTRRSVAMLQNVNAWTASNEFASTVRVGTTVAALASCRMGVGTGSTTVAPLRILTTGSVLLTTPLSGVIETDATDLYWTTGAATRNKIALSTTTLTNCRLGLAVGSTTIAPIRLTLASAVLNSTPQTGALECDTNDLYWTNSVPTRSRIATMASQTFTGTQTFMAGTTVAAPIKITTAGAALLTTAAAGSLETDGTDLYWTNNAAVRKKITIA